MAWVPMPPGVRDNPRVTPSPGGRGARIAGLDVAGEDRPRESRGAYERMRSIEDYAKRLGAWAGFSPVSSLKLLSFSLSSFVSLLRSLFLLSLFPFRDRRRWLSRNHVDAARIVFFLYCLLAALPSSLLAFLPYCLLADHFKLHLFVHCVTPSLPLLGEEKKWNKWKNHCQ